MRIQILILGFKGLISTLTYSSVRLAITLLLCSLNFRKAATQSIISRDWDFTKLGIGGLDKVIKMLSSMKLFFVCVHSLGPSP